MSWAAFNLADRKKLQDAVQNKRLLKAEGNRTKKSYSAKINSGLVIVRSPSLRDGRGLSGRQPN